MTSPPFPRDGDDGACFRVRGQVQGVGFRPFVWREAVALGLRGTVRNDAEGVLIEAWGPPAALDALERALATRLPPLASVTAIERGPLAGAAPAGFSIVATAGGAARTRVAPDAATCPACLAEIADPAGRRHGYAFTNCTHCGPRFSIVTGIPYDRAATTMAGFALCPACAAEYADPTDRRFHAQPIACPACGPRLWLEQGADSDDRAPLAAAARLLRTGRILAVKALGGFHLACDATDAAALAALRARKRRPAKPLALMARDMAQLARFAEVDAAAAALLSDPAAPIVLLRARPGALPDAVAPGQARHGWMLPCTPLHHLLLAAAGTPLVMTSGNLSGEPQVIEDGDARRKLGEIADAFLMHDRPIARRLDDSVAMIAGGRARLLRRARGFAPAPLALPEGFEDAPAVTAWGGQLKGAVCVAARGEALLSHHLGDLDEPLSWGEAIRAERDYAALFDHVPARLACDAHPDWRTTTQAEMQAQAAGLPLIRVQHHHAHIAAAMAEAGWPRGGGPVLGVAMDGLGWGPDGTVWGGEFLLCTYYRFERVGHLRPVPLPGGEAAQREPWRNLWAQLVAAGIDPAPLLPGRPLGTLAAMVGKGVNAPLSSSAGRLFDAVAAALGLAPQRLSFEGEAAMALESAALRHGHERGYPFGWDGSILDPAPMWHALLVDLRRGVPPGPIAARFHLGFAAAIRHAATALAARFGAAAIALGGGVFQNAMLLEACLDGLALPALVPETCPAGDGGLALGQAVVAAARRG
jgi:hydrogenase maturation protein HypF